MSQRSAANERQSERQLREDEAPRLSDEIPSLTGLRISIAHQRSELGFGGTEHVKVVVIPRAPALFFIPCGDPHCKDGGHDITDTVMRALRSGKTEFEGRDACHGSLGTAESRCTSYITYRGEAVYR
jgi:hypothetical protein